MQRGPKIGWILKGNEIVASSRIHGINIHNYLLKKGWQSKIFLQNTTSLLAIGKLGIMKILLEGCDVLIFQQVGYGDAYLLNRLNRIIGRKTCFSVCDLIDYDISRHVDSLIVPSEYLKFKFINENKNIIVIPDAIEHDTSFHKQCYASSSNKIKLVWIGTKDAWALLEPILDILNSPNYNDFELTTISDHPNSSFKWSLSQVDNIWKKVMQHDVAIIPSLDTDWYMSKSNNKLSTFLSLGMPVVAHPVPAYQKMKLDGAPVVLARTADEWCQALAVLRSEIMRESLGRSGRDYALPKFNIDRIGAMWEHFIVDISKKYKK